MEYLDEKHMKAAIPENVQDVYDEDAYRKWIAYHKDMTARFPERLSKDPA